MTGISVGRTVNARSPDMKSISRHTSAGAASADKEEPVFTIRSARTAGLVARAGDQDARPNVGGEGGLAQSPPIGLRGRGDRLQISLTLDDEEGRRARPQGLLHLAH